MCYNQVKGGGEILEPTKKINRRYKAMMIQEFIDRTGYTPSSKEYHYIEESYYDSPLPNKDEFCKQFKKDLRNGKWEMEYELRQRMDAQKAEYERKIAEQEENLQFYREQFKEKQQLLETVKRQNEKLEAVKRRTERLAALFED